MSHPSHFATSAGQVPRPQPAANRLLVRLLRSPAHHLLSSHLALLTVTGKRTGNRLTFPVMYAVDGFGHNSDLIALVDDAGRKTWWRNLTGPVGAPVLVRAAGREAPGVACVSEGDVDPAATAADLRVWLSRFPGAGSRLGAGRIRPGGPTPAQLARLAPGSVTVRIHTGHAWPARSALSRTRWVTACLLGELLGITVTAAAMGVLHATVGDPHGGGQRLAVWLAMVVAGSIEGLALGGMQWRALRRQLPALPARRWVGATVALAAGGWALGMLPSTLVSDETTGGNAGPPAWLLALLCVGGGLLAGIAFGAAQAWAARGYATGRGGWVLANAIAWAGALGWICLLATLPGSGWPTWAVGTIGALAGAGAGLTVGVVTSLWLPRLAPIPRRLEAAGVRRIAG